MLNVTYITWYTFGYGRPGTVVALHPLRAGGHEPRPTVVTYPRAMVLPRTLRLSVQHGLLAGRHLTLTCTDVHTSTVLLILSNVKLKVVERIQTRNFCKDKNTILTSESINNMDQRRLFCNYDRLSLAKQRKVTKSILFYFTNSVN